MKTKKKAATLKEIEKGFKNWEDDSERMDLVKKRNASIKKKNSTINMRVSEQDVITLKKIAEKKGIPYQTLLGMIIHQYISGTLVDVEEVKKILKAS